MEELCCKHRIGWHFFDRLATAVPRRTRLCRGRGHPPTQSGDADLRSVSRVVGLNRSSVRHALVMTYTSPCGPGPPYSASSRRRGKLNWLSLLPGVTEGGIGDQPASCTRDGWWWGDNVGLGRRRSREISNPLWTRPWCARTSPARSDKARGETHPATKISFIRDRHTLRGGLCGVPMSPGRGLRARIGPSSCSGWGYGGSCFTKDVSALSAEPTRDTLPTAKRSTEVNGFRSAGGVKLQRDLGSLVSKRIAILGLAFKPNPDDSRSLLAGNGYGGAEGAQVELRSRGGDRGSDLRPEWRMPVGAGDLEEPMALVLTRVGGVLDLDWSQVAQTMRGKLRHSTGAMRSTRRGAG